MLEALLILCSTISAGLGEMSHLHLPFFPSEHALMLASTPRQACNRHSATGDLVTGSISCAGASSSCSFSYAGQGCFAAFLTVHSQHCL